MKTKGTPIFLPNGKVVGSVYGDVFVKKVSSSKHFLQRPPAICFDVFTLESAKKAGATKVKITDTENGKQYYATIDFIFQKGFRLERGFGKQIALSLDNWQVGSKSIVQQEKLF